MADEQYKWLNRDAAERLLRGEPLEAVDADVRDRADRLAEALGALTADLPAESPEHPELPGEEAALAAFRLARSGKGDEATALGRVSRTHDSAPADDAGLVCLGRPAPGGRRARWGRPARYGLVAALAAGMLGGIAVAAGTGALPPLFRDDEPEPSVSVPAAGTSDRPLVSPSPEDTSDGGLVRSEPEPGESPDGGADAGAAPDDSAETGQPDDTSDGKGRSQQWWQEMLAVCREVRDGKNVDEMDADRRRSLEDAAGGDAKGHVKKYCDGLLSVGGGAKPGSGVSGGSGGKGRGGNTSGSAGSSGGDADSRDDYTRPAKDKTGKGNGRNKGNGGNSGGNGHWNKGNGGNSGGGNGHRNKGGGKTKGGNGKGGGNKPHGQGGAGTEIEAASPQLATPASL
ncbi:hypothetical protein SGFS_073840 [Streptomyces graminofaciens]|uniref:Uncharacterized protein n=1 Tax=Streptomyces graminofaciens TaxID=68212 RepID=A0ABM7FGA7_9ACTN|nr:hypothetical protein [Streptomyces graminofaciens]BBC36090.1 hypothetical protein SGFS_073840 [Streptomyces graminofaciens]